MKEYKGVIIVVVFIIAAIVIYKLMSGSNQTETKTVTSTKTGLAGLDVGGIFGSIFGGSKGTPQASVNPNADIMHKPTPLTDEQQLFIATGGGLG